MYSVGKSVSTESQPEAPLEDLAAWARATEDEIDEIRREMLPLEDRLAAANERLDLIRRLMGLADSAKRQPSATPQRSARGNVSGKVRPGASVEDHAEAILAEKGEPMHIGVLRDVLIARGVPLPGRGDEANIIVRLRRDETRFIRTGRGTYGLAVWGLPAVTPMRRKRVRRRKTAKS
jgi:HB1, ASXL, restriction endonuclease HTH domain